MKPFQMDNAKTVEEAVSLLGAYMRKAKVIAGGVDIIRLMKNEIMQPDALVNIMTIPGLSYIRKDNDGLKIGALTTIHDIDASKVIRERYSILAKAAHSVAAPQLRNMSTIGGNLCQEVSCWYYRMPPVTGRSFFCRRKGGKQCYAVTGDNTYHAIINSGKCHAVCPSDMAVALIALDANVNITSQDGDRTIPLADLYTNVGTILKSDEIITEIQVPHLGPPVRQRYLKFRIRKTIDFAIVNVAVTLTVEAGLVSDARIVLGGVAPTPYRTTAAEESIKGNRITANVAEMVAKEVTAEAKPLGMNDYKLPIAEALVKKAILEQN